MAVLDPKESVLRLLDPQPADGTGPGYISALDVKTTCGNLYDQIERVNLEIVDFPDKEVVQRLVDAQENREDARTRMLAPLVDEFGVPRSNLTADDLVRLLIRFVIDSPEQLAAHPGETIFDPTVTTAVEINAKYFSELPVRWGNAVVTINSEMYHWNAVSFERVAAVPTSLPNPYAIQPGDVLVGRNLHELTPAYLFSVGLRGFSAAWPDSPAGSGNFFTISGPGSSREYYWVVDKSKGGHFEDGRQA